MMRIPLPIGTYGYPQPSASSRLLVNCTAERAPVDGKSPVVLRRMGGVSALGSAGTSHQGAYLFKGDAYTVSGNKLYRVGLAGGVTELGTVGPGRATFAGNGTDLAVCVGNSIFYTNGSDFAASGIVASDVASLDGFFFFSQPNSQQIINTALDSRSLDADGFISIDAHGDRIVGILADHQELIIAKEETTEIWYDAGRSPGSPLARTPSGVLEVGCANRDTLKKIDNGVFWLADDGTVRRLEGSNPRIISNLGIADQIASQDTSQVYAQAYTYRNRLYYALVFPALALEYDIAAGEWHNRETYGEATWMCGDIIDTPAGPMAFDKASGSFGILGEDRTEFGRTQSIRWIYQPIYSGGRRLSHRRLELSLASGVGAGTGQGANPEIILELSDDGGNIFYEHDRRFLGAEGQYLTQVFWNGLGSSNNRVYRCTVTDPVAVLAVDTTVDIVEGGF